MSEQSGGLDRRSFVSGALSTLGIVGGIAAVATGTDEEKSDRPLPSSEIVSAESVVYDDYADMCAIAFVVDVTEGERIVFENEMDGSTDSVVDANGKRMLKEVIPKDSALQVYAVNLAAHTSSRLKTYRLNDECGLVGEQ